MLPGLFNTVGLHLSTGLSAQMRASSAEAAQYQGATTSTPASGAHPNMSRSITKAEICAPFAINLFRHHFHFMLAKEARDTGSSASASSKTLCVLTDDIESVVMAIFRRLRYMIVMQVSR